MWELSGQIEALRQAKSPYEGMRLDVRDELQRKFVDARLRFVGKNPENSPNLFARLEQKSRRDIGTGVAALAPVSNAEADIDADCDSPFSLTQDPNNAANYLARVITSCFSGSDYSYVDLFWWNSATHQVVAYDFAEDFTDPRDLVLSIPAESAQIGTTLHVDSMTINSRGIEDHYFFDGVIQERPAASAGLDTISAPRDENRDNTVITCLDRFGLDCDYYFAGTTGNIMLPISMSFRFPGQVNGIIDATAQVHMTDDGGVCQTNSLMPYTTSAAGAVIINTGNPISFGNLCVWNQTNVRFWVKLIISTTRGVYSLFWANDLSNDPTRRFALMFRWSCLAEGSAITMADGTTKPVELVRLGDEVRSDVPGRSQKVVDITKGNESALMVEVTDTHGRTVLVTEGHPFFDESGFAVRADSLRAGTRVDTADGLTTIARVERKPYGGQVFNLKLGTDEEAAASDVSKIHMFANGYRVGDARSQWELEVQRRELAQVDAPKAEWTADYLARKQFLE